MGARQVTRRAVFDTNVAVSAMVFRSGRLSWLRLAWSTGALVPVISDLTVKELLRVLAYPKFALDKDEIDELLSDYLPYAEVWSAAVPRSRVQVPDASDAMFVDLAIAAKVDLLVSGDKHLTDLGNSSPVTVVKPDELRRLLDP